MVLLTTLTMFVSSSKTWLVCITQWISHPLCMTLCNLLICFKFPSLKVLKTLMLHYCWSVYNLSPTYQYSLQVSDINNLTERTNFRVSLAKALMKSNITSKPNQPEKLLDIFPSWKNLDWGTVSVLTSPKYSRATNDIQQEDHYTYL